MPHYEKKQPFYQISPTSEQGGVRCDPIGPSFDLSDDLYRFLFDRVVRIARKMGVAPDQCEDVAQETLLEAVKKREEMRGEYSDRQICSWLLRHVAPHKAVDWLRHHKKGAIESSDRVEALVVEGARTDEGSECLAVLLERLQRAHPENCWLLCQHHLEGRSIQELADETGRTTRGIRNRMFRAIEKLRRWAAASSFDDEAAP